MNEDNLRNGQTPDNREEEHIDQEPVKTPLDEEEDLLFTEEIDVEGVSETDPDDSVGCDFQDGREECQDEAGDREDPEEELKTLLAPPAEEKPRCSWWRTLAVIAVILVVLNVMWTQMNKKIASQAETTTALQAMVEKMNGDYESAQKNLEEMKAAMASIDEEMAGFQDSLDKVAGSAERHETYLRNDLNRQRAALSEMSRLIAVQESLLEGTHAGTAAETEVSEAVPAVPAVLEEQLRINVETLRLTKESLEMTKAALNETEVRLTAAEERAASAEKELETVKANRDAERAELEEALAAMTARAEKAEADLAEAQKSLEELNAEAVAAAKEAKETEEALNEKIASLETAVAEEKARAEAAEKALDDTKALLEKIQAETAESAGEREGLLGKIGALTDKVAAMEEKLQASQAKLTSTEASLEAARQELALVRSAEEPVVEAEEPAAAAEEPAAEPEVPAVETGEPAAEPEEPALETEEPVVEEEPAASPDQA